MLANRVRQCGMGAPRVAVPKTGLAADDVPSQFGLLQPSTFTQCRVCRSSPVLSLVSASVMMCTGEQC